MGDGQSGSEPSLETGEAGQRSFQGGDSLGVPPVVEWSPLQELLGDTEQSPPPPTGQEAGVVQPPPPVDDVLGLEDLLVERPEPQHQPPPPAESATPWPAPEELIDESEMSISVPDIPAPIPPPVTDQRPEADTASVSAWVDDPPPWPSAGGAPPPPTEADSSGIDSPPPEHPSENGESPPPPALSEDPLDFPPPPIRGLTGSDSDGHDIEVDSADVPDVDTAADEPSSDEPIEDSVVNDGVPGENLESTPEEGNGSGVTLADAIEAAAADGDDQPEVSPDDNSDPLADLLDSPPPELLAEMLGAPSGPEPSMADSIDVPPAELLAQMFEAPSSEEQELHDVPLPPNDQATPLVEPKLDVAEPADPSAEWPAVDDMWSDPDDGEAAELEAQKIDSVEAHADEVDADPAREVQPIQEPPTGPVEMDAPIAAPPVDLGGERPPPPPPVVEPGEAPIPPPPVSPVEGSMPPAPLVDPWVQPVTTGEVPSADQMPAEPDVWSPLEAPPGESPSQPHSQQWQDETPWGASPPVSTEEPTAYSWHVPARRDTSYDGPMYTKTGDIVPAAPAPTVEAPKPPKAPPPGVAVAPPPDDGKRSKGGLVGRVLLIGALLALAGGGVFAVRQAFLTTAGPASPELAAEQMVAALENQDVLGVYELWLPSERETISADVVHFFNELDRLEGDEGLFSSLVEADEESGEPTSGTFELAGVTYEIESVGPTVSYLTTTGGTFITELDPDAVPEFASETVGELSADDLRSVTDLGDEPVSVAVVEENGGWYFSLYYSVAESLRRSEGKPNPAFEGQRLAVGADEPKEAVEEMIQSVFEFDFTGVLNRLDPVEFRALYDYREFLDPTIEELSADTDEDFTGDIPDNEDWELTRIVTSSNDIRGRETVGVELLEATLFVDGEKAAEITMADGCFDVSFTNDEPGFNSCEPDTNPPVEFTEATPEWLWTDRAQINIRVIERDGRWYVSGWPTIMGNLTDQLAAMSPAQWEARKNELTDFFESLPDASFEVPAEIDETTTESEGDA